MTSRTPINAFKAAPVNHAGRDSDGESLEELVNHANPKCACAYGCTGLVNTTGKKFCNSCIKGCWVFNVTD